MARRTPTVEQKQAAEERRARMRELAGIVSHMYGHPRPPVALEIGSQNAICLFCAEQHAA